MEEKYTRRIIKVSNYSYAVTLPREVVAAFRWQKGQQVVLTTDAKTKKIEIQDWEEK